MFGDVIDYEKVTIRRRKWFPFQPRTITMAPRGHVHFHPRAEAYCDDFSKADILRQGLLIHELVHVWQVQTRGKWFLVTRRMPWARYDYALRPGWPLVPLQSAVGTVCHILLPLHAELRAEPYASDLRVTSAMLNSQFRNHW